LVVNQTLVFISIICLATSSCTAKTTTSLFFRIDSISFSHSNHSNLLKPDLVLHTLFFNIGCLSTNQCILTQTAPEDHIIAIGFS
jgi:hypothetical protein